MVLRPVGPLSPGVYWFRRLLVLVVVVAVVWVGWRWFAGDDAAEPSASATPTPTATASAEPEPTDESPAPTDSPSPSASPTKTSNLPVCKDQDVSVAVSTDAESYPPDVDPRFTLTVANDSDQPCQRDLGPAALELRVTSGGATVWSSDHCGADGPAEPTALRPNRPYTESVTWGRQASQPGCPSGEPAADPGSYEVIARNGDLLSEPATFTLE